MKWIDRYRALTFVTLAVAACGGESGELSERERPVDVVASRSVFSPGVLTVPATVLASQQAELATRMSGTIRQLLVDIGSRVSAGQPLVTLDTKEIDARVESAGAAAELAQRWHDRIAALARDGAATAQELDDAEARLEMAEAGFRDARAQRDYVVLRAPFSGVITARGADPGDLAMPGMPILEMIGEGALKIQADLPAELAGRLAVGDDVAVYQPETKSRHVARVTRVVPAVERASRRFRIEARFEPGLDVPQVPPGAFVRLEIEQLNAVTRWIPTDAVVKRGQLSGVFVVDGDELRLRWVRLGRQLGEATELLAGPNHAAMLVREPSAQIADGQPVGSVREVDWTPSFLEVERATGEGV
jgi:RND family efflux transporter MFP subunit